jgi:NADPH-dependent 2,4-dienoyl-CoA reductase/sulfur reductase-like enzyme
MRFVIIGGDAAGMSAASRVRRRNPDFEVVVLEQTRDVSYSACGMPYNLANPNREMEDLVVRQAHVFRSKQGIDLRLEHRVEKLDPKARKVMGAGPNGQDFELKYDRLLLATGAKPVIPDLAGMDLPGITPLKNLEDGRRIKNLVARGAKKAVILGMGYVGLECAEALRERGVEVEMIKPGPDFLPWLDRDLASEVETEVLENGVKLHCGQTITGIEPDLKLSISGKDPIQTDMVLVAVGVVPLSGLAKEARLEMGPSESISVDRALYTSDPNILAAGDCADAYHVVTGKKTWIPLALRANRAGWAAADNAEKPSVFLPGVAGTAVFRVFKMEVARTGLTEKEAMDAGFNPASVTIRTNSRAHAHPGASSIHVHMVGDKDSGRLLGVQMVGKEGVAHRINAPAVALHGRMTVAQYAQSDLAYAPPFGPTWDPTLVAANQLLKRL